MCSNKVGVTYRDAGVDIDAGNKAVELMKDAVQRTYTPGVVGDIGGFGGLYSLAGHSMSDPMLVSGTDGVGTKLRLAIMMDKHDTIGQDCVAMSVNDILVQGATPLFFLDYVAVGKLDPVQVADIVRGVAGACEESGCALLGGETAEMAGFYGDGDYDVAGFAVGIVDRPKLITGESIKAGDVILGLPSSGVHSNGFSLVRKIVFELQGLGIDDVVPEFGKTVGEELLTPTRLYPKAVLPLIQKEQVKGMVHITGGGFYENIPRVLPKGVCARVDVNAWPRLPVFSKLQEWGNVAWPEMYRTFNMGIGMILIVSADDAAAVKADLEARGEAVYEIGRIEDGYTPVILEGREFGA
ncbi:phosphoribosylformylglycinamidine cyclo-ligase [Veillonella sp. YH-vei2232]|uniref:Phosphoribosylformylglycinamidine cyclo-ligase n=1 Tax=Veillonella absiana TaxID=3079305 RepID=A0ABU3Z6K7_9FIRM|nr:MULTISPECIES: phosphoribosylformylglycinamidine cyclo-ligase [unclassified Veillonella]MDV5063386.1 phosphoribosylformylglycinamidine cyclo-ligase [Veillonella sp. YH-vei2232]MDV5087346.1 phosphoribosylformylglycinamidine cyclo-ligase [Veillonella sp. YH-vei2233]NCB95404.1 phosphoribosylformylglycinamidine cyclo-ligase [Negativicutes bacterium]